MKKSKQCEKQKVLSRVSQTPSAHPKGMYQGYATVRLEMSKTKGELVTFSLFINSDGYPEITIREVDPDDLEKLMDTLLPEYVGKESLLELVTETSSRLNNVFRDMDK